MFDAPTHFPTQSTRTRGCCGNALFSLLLALTQLSAAEKLTGANRAGDATQVETEHQVCFLPAPKHQAVDKTQSDIGQRESVLIASSQIVNFSARAMSGSGPQVLIMGFVVSGGSKNLLLRGVGPSLASFGVPNALVDPSLTLFGRQGTIAANDDWQVNLSGRPDGPLIAVTAAQVGAFALSNGSRDSALVLKVDPGAYTTGLQGPNSGPGVALTEIYDAGGAPGARLTNVSARMNLSVDDTTLVAGLVIAGNVPQNVLIRGVGPTLSGFAVTSALADPRIAVVSGRTQVASNDNWETGASTAAQVIRASVRAGAFALPSGSKDAVLLLALQPGPYTVLVTSADGSTGVVLVEVYEVPTDNGGVMPGSFTATGSLGTARCDFTATLLLNGKVLVTGGETVGDDVVVGEVTIYDGGLASAELYDPATGRFAPTGSMATTRIDFSAVLLPNGKVLVAGGETVGDGVLASAELYDPATGTFASTGSMITARTDYVAALLPNGKVLIAGGETIGDGVLASAELYDPATGTFVATGSMTTARTDCTAVLLPNGRVLIVGGETTADGVLASAELYDPATGVFTATGSMTTARESYAAVMLPNGKLLIAGGQTTGDGVLASAELYDPATGTFVLTGSMNTARTDYPAVLLSSGKVLVAGGVTIGDGRIASAELYDSATGTFTVTAPMMAARTDHAAVLLPNGKVLIAGGEADDPLASAELYQ